MFHMSSTPSTPPAGTTLLGSPASSPPVPQMDTAYGLSDVRASLYDLAMSKGQRPASPPPPPASLQRRTSHGAPPPRCSGAMPGSRQAMPFPQRIPDCSPRGAVTPADSALLRVPCMQHSAVSRDGNYLCLSPPRSLSLPPAYQVRANSRPPAHGAPLAVLAHGSAVAATVRPWSMGAPPPAACGSLAFANAAAPIRGHSSRPGSSDSRCPSAGSNLSTFSADACAASVQPTDRGRSSSPGHYGRSPLGSARVPDRLRVDPAKVCTALKETNWAAGRPLAKVRSGPAGWDGSPRRSLPDRTPEAGDSAGKRPSSIARMQNVPKVTPTLANEIRRLTPISVNEIRRSQASEDVTALRVSRKASAVHEKVPLQSEEGHQESDFGAGRAAILKTSCRLLLFLCDRARLC